MDKIDFILEDLKRITERLKRIETKQTHEMEVLGINTQNTKDAETSFSLITIKKVDTLLVVSLLHKDIPLIILENFLKNHFGEIKIVCGDDVLWTIKK